MAKRFMFVCLGLLALAVAYHLGASSVQSQGTGTFVSLAPGPYMSSSVYALTSDGDLYGCGVNGFPTFAYLGNFNSAPTSTQSTTWGQIKASFKE